MKRTGAIPRTRLKVSGVSVLLLSLALLAGCATTTAPESTTVGEPVEITVSAATTLKKAFEKMAVDFEAETGTKVKFNFGAAGVLQKQIEGGAVVDVFASAAPKQMNELIEAGLVSADATATFASNKLVVFTRAGEEVSIEGARDLVALDRIATGNPESTPIGTAAMQWMQSAGLVDDFRARVIYGENVTQVMEYLTRGEVDAVVVFASEATGRDDVRIAYTVPDAAIQPIRYVIAPVLASKHPAEAAAFVDYVLSDAGRKALADAGFVLLDPAQ